MVCPLWSFIWTRFTTEKGLLRSIEVCKEEKNLQMLVIHAVLAPPMFLKTKQYQA